MLVRLNNYRVNGLALAKINEDISVGISELVDTFVSTKPGVTGVVMNNMYGYYWSLLCLKFTQYNVIF